MENFPLAINLTIVGLTVVFLALILLSFILYLSSKVLSMKKSERKKADTSLDEASMLEIEDEDNRRDAERIEAVSLHTDKTDGVRQDNELAAVIMAAIYASTKSEPGIRLRITSFKRIAQSTPVWNKAGRLEQIAGKL